MTDIRITTTHLLPPDTIGIMVSDQDMAALMADMLRQLDGNIRAAMGLPPDMVRRGPVELPSPHRFAILRTGPGT